MTDNEQKDQTPEVFPNNTNYTDQQLADLQAGTGDLRPVAEATFKILFNNIPAWWNLFCKVPTIDEVTQEKNTAVVVKCSAELKKPKRHLEAQTFVFPINFLGLSWPELKEQMDAYEQLLREKSAARGKKTLAKLAMMADAMAGAQPEATPEVPPFLQDGLSNG